jgi:hypothetical protein
LGPELFKDFEPAGLKGIGWWPGEFMLLASRKSVLEPEDLKGLKICTTSMDWQAGRAAELIAQKTSALLASFPPADLGRAIAQGLYDVREDSIEDIRALGVADLSVTLTNHLCLKLCGYSQCRQLTVTANLQRNTECYCSAHEAAAKCKGADGSSIRSAKEQHHRSLFFRT